MSAIGELLRQGAGRLREAGIAEARMEARLLLEAASGVPREGQLSQPDLAIEKGAQERYFSLIERRQAREPIAHILGRREFWSLNFKVTRHTLDPRPDSETLVQLTLDHVLGRSAITKDRGRWHAWRLLDLGAGAGCLLLALMSELPRAKGLGVDRSGEAVEIARENATTLGMSDRAQFQTGDWDRGLRSGWDIVISNPPYIATEAIGALEPEIAHFEPRLALDGGPDGLEAYRHVIPASFRLLARGGLAAFEFGMGQEAAIRALAEMIGLQWLETRADLAGVARAAIFRRP